MGTRHQHGGTYHSDRITRESGACCRLREEGSRRALGPVGKEAGGNLKHCNNQCRGDALRRKNKRAGNDCGRVATKCTDAAFHFRGWFQCPCGGCLVGGSPGLFEMRDGSAMVMRTMIQMSRLTAGFCALECRRIRKSRLRGRFRPRQQGLMPPATINHAGRSDPLCRNRQHHQPNQGGTECFQHGNRLYTKNRKPGFRQHRELHFLTLRLPALLQASPVRAAASDNGPQDARSALGD
jgi:hypothetical protein